MRLICTSLFFMAFILKSFAQIDTVILNETAVHLFPSFPVKSSYTSLFDKRPGMNYVYSANMELGLGIYDVTNPTIINPILNFGIANFNNLDVSTIEQKGNSLFVGIGDFQVNTNSASGLAIIDISNPAVPLVKDIWDSTIFHHGISHLIIEGNYAYLSTMSDGIIILEVSNENNILFQSFLQLDLNFPAPSTNAHNARGLKYKNDTLYVCFDRGGLRAIDVTNKNNPAEIYKYINNSLNSQAAAAYNDIALKGNYAFVSVDYCGLEVLDISTIPFTPVQWYNPWGCNTGNWSGAEIHTNELMLSNNDSLLFVTAGQSELLVFDITEPLNTSKIGEFVNLNDTLATHGLDVWENKIVLSLLHTPIHIPPFTPFFADPGGLKLLSSNYTLLSTSIHEENLNNESIIIFPNPNRGNILTIESKEEDISEIIISNPTGQIIEAKKEINQPVYSLNMTFAEKGVYFVFIKTKNRRITKKVILY